MTAAQQMVVELWTGYFTTAIHFPECTLTQARSHYAQRMVKNDTVLHRSVETRSEAAWKCRSPDLACYMIPAGVHCDLRVLVPPWLVCTAT